MSKPYVYLLSCPDVPWWPIDVYHGELIDQLQESSSPVRYETMKQHCEGLDEWLLWIGIVDTTRGLAKLFREIDWIDFRKGVYDGMPCYFVDWSAIEFIWVRKDVLKKRRIVPPVAPWKTGRKFKTDVFSWLK